MTLTGSRTRERVFTALLAAGGLLAAILLTEGAIRIAGLAPHDHASARLVDARWRELLDAYPSNPRGYFDLDLRDPATRERYHHLAHLRYDLVARRTPFAVVSH